MAHPRDSDNLQQTAGEAVGPDRSDGAREDPAPDIDQLLKKAETEVADLKDAWLRARADAENLRRQSQSDIAKAHKYAVEKFAEDLLPVKDALEQTLNAGDVSLETLISGAGLTLKALQAAFERAKIQEIDPKPGEKFDPHRQQAMQMVDASSPANTVVTVFQKGYLLNDRVLRPALVSVSRGAAPVDAEGARPQIAGSERIPGNGGFTS
jgi:molecular chaperone GrpE